MSDQQPAPGWWQASDGRWYPPDQHPDVRTEQPVSGPAVGPPAFGAPGAPGPSGPPGAPPPGADSKRNRRVAIIVAAIVAVAIVGIGAIALGGGDDDGEDRASATTDDTEPEEDEEVSTTRPPDTQPADTSPPETEVPAGFRLIENPEEGFSIAVPESWQDFESFDLDDGTLDQFAESNPDLAATLEQARQLLDQGGVLFAVDPVPTAAGYSANVNMLRAPLPGRFDAQLLDEQLRTQFESGLGARDLVFEDVVLPAGDAVKATYTLPLNIPTGGSVDLAGVQYYVPSDSGMWVLTLTSDPAVDMSSTFDAIADSLVVD